MSYFDKYLKYKNKYDTLLQTGGVLALQSPEIRKQRLARQNVERVVKDQERKAILDAQMLYQYQEKEKNKNIKSSQKPELIPVLQDFDIPREKFKHAFKLSDEFKINNLTEYDLQKIRELIDVYDRFSSYIDNFQNFRFGVMDFFEELIIIYNYHLYQYLKNSDIKSEIQEYIPLFFRKNLKVKLSETEIEKEQKLHKIINKYVNDNNIYQKFKLYIVAPGDSPSKLVFYINKLKKLNLLQEIFLIKNNKYWNFENFDLINKINFEFIYFSISGLVDTYDDPEIHNYIASYLPDNIENSELIILDYVARGYSVYAILNTFKLKYSFNENRIRNYSRELSNTFEMNPPPGIKNYFVLQLLKYMGRDDVSYIMDSEKLSSRCMPYNSEGKIIDLSKVDNKGCHFFIYASYIYTKYKLQKSKYAEKKIIFKFEDYVSSIVDILFIDDNFNKTKIKNVLVRSYGKEIKIYLLKRNYKFSYYNSFILGDSKRILDIKIKKSFNINWYVDNIIYSNFKYIDDNQNIIELGSVLYKRIPDNYKNPITQIEIIPLSDMLKFDLEIDSKKKILINPINIIDVKYVEEVNIINISDAEISLIRKSSANKNMLLTVTLINGVSYDGFFYRNSIGNEVTFYSIPERNIDSDFKHLKINLIYSLIVQVVFKYNIVGYKSNFYSYSSSYELDKLINSKKTLKITILSDKIYEYIGVFEKTDTYNQFKYIDKNIIFYGDQILSIDEV